MSNYLLAIAIGPVQEFIASARRTRDLWFGSFVLSEISKAVAKSLSGKSNKNGVKLIFPAPKDINKDLEPRSELNVANKILALIPEGKDPEEIAEKAKKSAEDVWKKFAKETLSKAQQAIRQEIWDEQIDDVLEFYYAWVPLEKSYKQARERVERILAGRKALRDFLPAKGRAGVPKSSLDGARESVLIDRHKIEIEILLKTGLKENEHLDSVGLIKRLAGDPEKFISVSRIASDPWVRGISQTKNGKELLDKISSLCHPDFSGKIKDEMFKEFPWEGEVLFISRLDSMLKDKTLEKHYKDIEEIKDLLREAKLGEPSPYLGILLADGDRMGAILSKILSKKDDPDRHREFSKTLSEFSGKARTILRKYRGTLVYSGGDDVLAFVPFDMALEAARELHDEFCNLLKDFKTDGINPTLSIGLAIGHCHETLEDLLNQGRAAEREAKGDNRDGFAIKLTTRSADSITVRRQWVQEPDKSLDKRLKEWAKLILERQIPDTMAYDIYELWKEYSDMKKSKVWENIPEELLKKEAERIIKKKRGGGNKKIEGDILEKLLATIKKPDDLQVIASEFIIARHLSEALKKARGPASEKQEVKE